VLNPRHVVSVLAIVSITQVSAAGRASAHATFPATSTVASGDRVRLTLNVPEERGDTVHNAQINVLIPTGWTQPACAAPPTWTCAPGSADGQATLNFTKTAGTDPLPTDENVTLILTAGPPGTAVFKVNQVYSSGESVLWGGPAASETPAPLLQVTAAAPTTTVPTTTPNSAPAPTTAATTTRPANPPSAVPTSRPASATADAPLTTVVPTITASPTTEVATLSPTTVAPATTVEAASTTLTSAPTTTSSSNSGGSSSVGPWAAGFVVLLVAGAGIWTATRRQGSQGE
jgi:hypothetical protein